MLIKDKLNQPYIQKQDRKRKDVKLLEPVVQSKSLKPVSDTFRGER